MGQQQAGCATGYGCNAKLAAVGVADPSRLIDYLEPFQVYVAL